ncbi:MAG TPA: hypothetical protein VK547_09755 [Candidatus Udaeobacter sp.]|nr:hypothetical protein [Candidatus Udaeobacter sp.]
MRIGISGHRGFDAETTRLIEEALREQLRQYADAELTGVSCLADGADQLFAQAVLDLGGILRVIIPGAGYRDALPEDARDAYDALLARAEVLAELDGPGTTSEAHMAASVAMLENIDALFAVWDGKPARGYGGTADVVNEARARRLPVTVVWPDGARRD